MKNGRAIENLSVAAFSIVAIILLLVIVGFSNIKFWLTSPIEWDEPDYIQIMLVGKEESYGNMNLEFLVRNGSSYKITDYEFYVTSGNSTVRVSSFMNKDLLPNDFTSVFFSFAQGGSIGYFFDELHGLDVEDIEMEYRIKSLTADHEKIVDNSSWIKIIIILSVSLTAGILVLNDIVKVTWLRIIMKIMCVPAILIILAVGVVLLAGGDKGTSAKARASSDKQTKERAAANYKRAANLKAGALAHGDTKGAARAQAEMDRYMADMVTGNSQSSAKANYKREAQLRAGAQIQGNQREAAKAQARMDNQMADMIRDK